MATYSIAKEGEEDKILDFANYVFSASHKPHDFRTLLPKVYGKDVKNAQMHYVARSDDGSLLAMVCLLSIDLNICGNRLKCGIIGTVSVHPYARGEGHMKRLMELVLNDSLAKGLDVLALSGQRQRYNYFGFDYAGYCYEYLINSDNIRHSLFSTDISSYSLQTIKEETDPLCGRCFKLYEKGLVSGARAEQNFLLYSQSWASKLHAVIKNGEFAGYLIDNEWDGKTIKEILLEDESDIYAVLKLWFSESKASNTTLRVWPHEQARIELLNILCEKASIIPGQMINILNYENVLRACLSLKTACTDIDDHEAVIRIDNENLLLRVSDGAASCEKTIMIPDTVLSGLEAVRMLFSHTSLFKRTQDKFSNWLPLPWVMPAPDRF